MSSNKYIKVVQKDYIENTESLIFEGNAKVSVNEKYTIEYEENPSTNVIISIDSNQGYLKRFGETKTQIEFDINKLTNASLDSEYGKILMSVKTNEITLKDNNLMLGYTLMQDNSEVAKFLMKVEWDNE